MLGGRCGRQPGGMGTMSGNGVWWAASWPGPSSRCHYARGLQQRSRRRGAFVGEASGRGGSVIRCQQTMLAIRAAPQSARTMPCPGGSVPCPVISATQQLAGASGAYDTCCMSRCGLVHSLRALVKLSLSLGRIWPPGLGRAATRTCSTTARFHTGGLGSGVHGNPLGRITYPMHA